MINPKMEPHLAVNCDSVTIFKIAINIRNEPSENKSVKGLGLINKKEAKGRDTDIIITPTIKKKANLPHSTTFYLTISFTSFLANSVSSSP